MKKKFFTVIELLCVIGIIVLLASLLTPVVGKAISKSKKSRAQSEIASLKTAVSAFYAQYGYYPAGINSGTGKVSEPATFIKCLCNVKDGTTTTKYNPRGIAFLEWSGEDLTDPWGGEYQVYVDINRDSVIDKSDTGADSDLYTDVVVYSYGEDGSSASCSEWVKTWK